MNQPPVNPAVAARVSAPHPSSQAALRHFLDVDDVTREEFAEILALGRQRHPKIERRLEGLGVAAVFEKPSARTRNSTEIAVMELGGYPMYITDAEVGIDRRETAEDVARTLACYHAIICARVFHHDVLVRMAATAVAPVINLLSDVAHPLQAIADVLTIEAELGTVEDKTVTYVGDANNVTRSLAIAVGYCGGIMRVASPPGHQFSDLDVDYLRGLGGQIELFSRTSDAVEGADVIYTDTWVSMGQESEAAQRIRAFEGFQVNDLLLRRAPEAIFMHCLPAHRGEEVSADALDGPQSRIWPQAKNRLHAARAVLSWISTVNELHPASASATPQV